MVNGGVRGGNANNFPVVTGGQNEQSGFSTSKKRGLVCSRGAPLGFGALFVVFLVLTCPSYDGRTGFKKRLSIFIKAFEMRGERTAKLSAVLHCQNVIHESAYVFDLTR